MASLRVGYGLPASPSEGLRTRRADDAKNLGRIPRSMNNKASEKELEVSRITKQITPQSRLPSRVPQPSSTRQSSIPQPNSTTKVSRQSTSRGSTSTSASSSQSRSHTQSGSGSSSSSRSADSSLKPGFPVLRKKASSVSQDTTSLRNDSASTSSSSPKRHSRSMVDSALGIQYDRGLTDSPGEIYNTAEIVEIQHKTIQAPIIYPELDRYQHYERPSNTLGRPNADVPYRLATHDLPPPTPGSLFFSGSSSQLSVISGSPSTKFFGSPGPGPYSRDTTPTSISSQSPSLLSPGRGFPLIKNRQQSPLYSRPPVTRRRAGSTSNEADSFSLDPQGLAAVRESLTSSSSNSTVREGDHNGKRARKPGRTLPPPPPSPPPRKSSQKFSSPAKDDKSSPVKADRQLPKQKVTEVSTPPTSTTAPRPRQLPSPTTSRPSRPSRDGTPDIQSQLFSPVPVIQSNLSSRSGHAERRGSESSIPGPAPPSLGQTSKSASTSHLPAGGETTSTKLNSKSASDIKRIGATEDLQLTAAQSSSSSSFNSRFPFFGRKKPAAEGAQSDKKEKKKLTRKGPVAGTGHEGYGRLGAVRRRSGSGGTSAREMRDNQASKESLANRDSFLADRINPVVIAGGEIIENRNASVELGKTDSNHSMPYDRPSGECIASSYAPQTSRNASRTTLGPSAIPRGRTFGPSSRRPSDSSDSDGPAMKSTIAFRRSVHRLRTSPDAPLRLPQPINTSGVVSSPMTSFDTSILSDESFVEMQQQVSHGSSIAQSAPKKLKKKTRSPRKWNFFGRSKNQSDPNLKNEQVAATVTVVEKKPVPFYAMLDSSELEDTDLADIHEVLRSADVYSRSPNTPELNSTTSFRTPEIPPVAARASPQKPEVVLDQLPVALSGPVPSSSATSGVTLSSGRPSRLAQVGRIPLVISNRQEKPSPVSFSRPFRTSLQLHSPMTEFDDYDSIAKGPSPEIPSAVIKDVCSEGSTTGCGTEFSSCNGSVVEVGHLAQEFIAFSPRKNSDCTAGTCSSDSGANAFAEATAVIPNPEDPPAEDEVWDEYNDLLGDEGFKPPHSATSSKGIPFHLETYQSRLAKEKAMESPTIMLDSRKLSTFSKAPTHSTSYSADMTERIRAAFQPHPSPTTPHPVASDPRVEIAVDIEQPMASVTRHSASSSRKSQQSNCSSSSEESSPLAQVNLRVGSMTVSKWLTFGHVLFSDVRHELVQIDKDSLNRPSILVIDSLGNDDWSFYAAETYPAANFFNLSPRAPLPTDLQNSPTGYPLSPPNHHQIQYLSHLEKFPFAPQSFSCVVFRFPTAAPESHYRNVLSEARRVLKPGGFVELSILDVDLNNMGNRGRRTIRQLKERIHEKVPETNLASTADLILRLLGTGGFSGIKAARVGVPVASSIKGPNTEDASGAEKKKKKLKDQPSLAEMMSDSSPLADEGITSMVARVGRWWYTRCYENAAGPSTGKGVLNDKAFLSECEELGTSLKLMVCCARATDRITSF